MLFSPENLPYWIFLGAGVALFGLVILTGGGDDDIDTDIDADIDIDVNIDLDANIDLDIDADVDADFDLDADAELDTDAEVSAEGGLSALGLLGWFGIGKAPLILLLALDLCLWGLVGWMATVVFGSLLSVIPIAVLRLPILLGSMAIALTLGGLIAQPIGKIFASFGESASADRLVGCEGKVSSARLHNVTSGKIAQVDVVDPAKNLVTINAVLPLWAKTQPRIGEPVLVIERSDKAYLYFVIAKDSPDEDRWFSSISRGRPT